MKMSHIYITAICIVAIFQIPRLYGTWAEHDAMLKEIENKHKSEAISLADEKMRKEIIEKLASKILNQTENER